MTAYTQEENSLTLEKDIYITLKITHSGKCVAEVTQANEGLITIEEATGTSRIVLSPLSSVDGVTLRILEVNKESEKLIHSFSDQEINSLMKSIQEVVPVAITTESAIDFSNTLSGLSLRIELQNVVEAESKTLENLSDDFCCIPCDGWTTCACSVLCPNGGGFCCAPKCVSAGVCRTN